jgi:hypothetical protein
MLRRFLAYFTPANLARIFPQVDEAEQKAEEPLEIRTHRDVDEYVSATEQALRLCIQKGSMKETDKFVMDTRKHLIEVMTIAKEMK